MQPLVNPLHFIFIIATAFGVVMHDAQVDHATSVAVVAPSHVTNVASADTIARTNEHVHVERVSVNQAGATHHENVPKTQPRDDHNRYVQVKKQTFSGGNNTGLWPSI